MPRRDGTGPEGRGAMTGKRMGGCQRGNRCRNRFFFDYDNEAALIAQKELLEAQLASINKQLEKH